MAYRKTLKGGPVITALLASCAMLLPVSQSLASPDHLPPSIDCGGIPIGISDGIRKNSERYSGYYKLSDIEFWHIMSISGHIYIVDNDAKVLPLKQNNKGDFCFGSSTAPNLFFNFGSDSATTSIRLHQEATKSFAISESGQISQVHVNPSKDIIANQISKEMALSIYENVRSIHANLQSENQALIASRAPRPAQLSPDMDEKLKSFVAIQIDIMNEFDPHSFSEGGTQSIEYLGLSPQGEQVLKVNRERSVSYWRIIFDSDGHIKRTSITKSL